MKNRIKLQEFFAWVMLFLAIILLSVSVSFAQTRNVNVVNENGKVHIKIESTDNGKTTLVDTTFSLSENADIEKIINQLGGGSDSNLTVDKKIVIKEKNGSVKKGERGSKTIIIDSKHNKVLSSDKKGNE